MGGDDDIPYRERRKEKETREAREAAKRALGQGGEDLDTGDAMDVDEIRPEISTLDAEVNDNPDHGGEHKDGEHKEPGANRDAHPPAIRYRLTERMKGLIWNLVCLSNECCRIENEK